MRVWGRVLSPTTQGLIFGGPGVLGGPAVMGPSGNNAYRWVEVKTDAKGFNDYVYITALVQCLKLSINESPFWANWGIPGHQSVMQQVAPDYYAALMQQRYAPHFASLQITRVTAATQPTYQVNIVTNQGVVVQTQIPV